MRKEKMLKGWNSDLTKKSLFQLLNILSLITKRAKRKGTFERAIQDELKAYFTPKRRAQLEAEIAKRNAERSIQS